MGRGRKRHTLEGRAWTRRALIRDLALAEQTHEQLAVKYAVSRESISRFKKRHLAEIEDVVARADEEFAGILISVKANRLDLYQKMICEAEDTKDYKLAARLLRQVAEEMGHLPSRMQISGAVDVHTSYTITGEGGQPIDLNKLT